MNKTKPHIAKKIEEQFQSYFADWDANDSNSARLHWNKMFPGIAFNTIHEGLTADLGGHSSYIYRSGAWYKQDPPPKPIVKPFMFYCVFGEFRDGGIMVIQPINVPWHKKIIPALKALIREREGVKKFKKYWSVDFSTSVDTEDDPAFMKIKAYDKYKWEGEKFVLVEEKELAHATNN